jgi:hypothetical protein
MATFLNFGSGAAGTWAPGTTTFAPYDSSCSGTAGSTSLTATNASFSAGQHIFIHQSRGGSNVGKYEHNVIASYTTGTITTVLPLSYTYTDSGNEQAQVIVMPQYSGANLAGTLTGKAWDGNVGGIIPILCNGSVSISGTVNLSGKGYRGAGGGSDQQLTGRRGEGTTSHDLARTTSAQGNGGGGGTGGAGDIGLAAAAGGGGGNGTAGTTGTGLHGGAGGVGGAISSSADLATMTFGGAGGEGGTRNNTFTTNAVEGYGGGIIVVFSNSITVTGSLNANGQNAVAGDSPYGEGGGAGGSILLVGNSISIGTSLVTASGGAGANGASGVGGSGGSGVIRIVACSLSGTTIPSASTSLGGHSFCSSLAYVY